MTLWWYEGQGWRLWKEMESCWKGVQPRCSLVQLPEGTVAQCGGPCSKCSPCQPIYINYQPTFCCPLKRTLRDKVKNSSISKDILLSHILLAPMSPPLSGNECAMQVPPSFHNQKPTSLQEREREYKLHKLVWILLSDGLSTSENAGRCFHIWKYSNWFLFGPCLVG